MPRAANLDTGVTLTARDVITAEVRYISGRESYSNIKLNGKPSKAGILGQVGLSTNGEFGTILENLFDKESGAEFKLLKEEGSARVFEFHVGVEKSKWIIGSSRRMMRIPYHGRIWVDKATNRITRIEQQAELDGRFSFSENTVKVDYGEVRLGDRGTFQLPLKSESTACLRGQQQSCFVNEVVFQNCRKFTVKSRIVEAEESPTTTPQVQPQ